MKIQIDLNRDQVFALTQLVSRENQINNVTIEDIQDFIKALILHEIEFEEKPPEQDETEDEKWDRYDEEDAVDREMYG